MLILPPHSAIYGTQVEQVDDGNLVADLVDLESDDEDFDAPDAPEDDNDKDGFYAPLAVDGDPKQINPPVEHVARAEEVTFRKQMAVIAQEYADAEDAPDAVEPRGGTDNKVHPHPATHGNQDFATRLDEEEDMSDEDEESD